jgi:hypothetical protein
MPARSPKSRGAGSTPGTTPKRYVDRELALEVWGPSHADIYEHGCFVLDVYETELHRRPWNYFEDFGREATARRAGPVPAVTAPPTPALEPD